MGSQGTAEASEVAVVDFFWRVGSGLYLAIWRLLAVPRERLRRRPSRDPNLTGSYAHADRLYRFRVQGRVVDFASGQNLAGVAIVFLDTGLDFRRSVEPEQWARSVGQSDAQGAIGLDFQYLWGHLAQGPEDLPSTRTVRIRLVCQGYPSAEVDFDLTRTPRDGRRFVLDLGTISLSRAGATAPVNPTPP